MPVGPLKFRKLPEGVKRQLDVAAAASWEAIVEAHTGHALRFIALLAPRMAFDEAVERYLAEMDVRDPMAASIRSRVLVAMEHAATGEEGRPTFDAGGSGDEDEGLGRFRPDRLMRGIARKYRETEATEEWVRLAIARAEEGLIRAHIDNAVTFAAILRGQATMDEAVEDYIETLRLSGGRAQAVYQRTMARLADLHLPGSGAAPGAPEDGGDRSIPGGDTGSTRGPRAGG